MRIVDLQNNQSDALILFFAGWGYDEWCVAHLQSLNYDVKVVYDYRQLEPIALTLLSGYASVTVIAWSFGVWVADVVLNEVSHLVTNAYAINGTLLPVDDSNGIPKAVFDATLEGLNERSYQKFQMRVMGGVSNYKRNANYLPKRAFADQKEELQSLAKDFMHPIYGNLPWCKAICGNEDLIFPLENLIHFWGDEVLLRDYPHFIFDHFLFWDELLNDFSHA